MKTRTFLSLIFIGLLALCFTACGGNSTPDTAEDIELDLTLHDPDPDTDPDPVRLGIEEKQANEKRNLDSIYDVVNQWNQGLNQADYALLAQVYGDPVTFYTTQKSRSALIDSKRSYLEKHPDFQQKIEFLSVQYPRNLDNIARCEFTKSYGNGAYTDKVEAVLHIQQTPGDYRIVKESDRPSEMMVVRKMPTADLRYGSYTFTYDFWLDTRDDETLGHDFVPYYDVLKLDYQADSLEVTYYSYNGSMRVVTGFWVKEARLSDGYLTFKGAAEDPWTEREEADYTEEEYLDFRFKILGTQEVVEVYGADQYDNRLWRVEHAE